MINQITRINKNNQNYINNIAGKNIGSNYLTDELDIQMKKPEYDIFTGYVYLISEFDLFSKENVFKVRIDFQPGKESFIMKNYKQYNIKSINWGLFLYNNTEYICPYYIVVKDVNEIKNQIRVLKIERVKNEPINNHII